MDRQIWGKTFLDKFGKYILIRSSHIDLAQNWFSKYGSGVIFTARFIPVVRHAISIPAGIARMPFSKFSFYTLIAIIPWSVLFIYLGMNLGAKWEQINQAAKPFVTPAIIIAILITLIFLLFKWFKQRNKNIKN